MKVIYYSKSFFSDCDFPLVKALQDKGVDVHYYIPLPRKFRRSVLFNFREPMMKMRFFKASRMEEMQIYKDAIDLNRLYFISGYRYNEKWLPSWILWLYALRHMTRLKADIFHFDWPFSGLFERFMPHWSFKGKRIITIHDPIPHSGNDGEEEEKVRKRSFRWADNFILLNDVQGAEFSERYSVSSDKIYYSHLGAYNTIASVNPKASGIKEPYILFFGFIAQYKGLEYLLDAMKKVHKQCPDLKLVVAGGGELYFDATQYLKAGYIEWRNRYIDMQELAGLLKDCEFTVCPYKDATQSGVIQTSFSMGTPAIATNVGALPKSVCNGETGLIVPPCDVESLASSIIHLHQDKDLLQSMRNNIRDKWLPSMSWDSIADEYISIYYKILKK